MSQREREREREREMEREREREGGREGERERERERERESMDMRKCFSDVITVNVNLGRDFALGVWPRRNTSIERDSCLRCIFRITKLVLTA